MRKFRLHFNRINMQRGNPNVWTVHMSGVCHQVKLVKPYVPMETRYVPNGPQPRAYFVGRGYLYVRKGVAYILDDNAVAHMPTRMYYKIIQGS